MSPMATSAALQERWHDEPEFRLGGCIQRTAAVLVFTTTATWTYLIATYHQGKSVLKVTLDSAKR